MVDDTVCVDMSRDTMCAEFPDSDSTVYERESVILILMSMPYWQNLPSSRSVSNSVQSK